MIDFSKYQAVIFDLDGTLVDSMWIWQEIDINYLRKHNYEMPQNLQRQIEGMSTVEVANYFKEKFSIADSIEIIQNEWLNMAHDYYAHHIGLKNGVRQLLDYLKQNSIKMGIGTANFRDLAELVLAKNGIADYFETLRTACEFKRGKPFLDVFLGVAKSLEVSPDKCLVFEDTIAGVMAAKRAGMDVIAIADDSSRSYADELRSAALYYLEDFTPLLQK